MLKLLVLAVHYGLRLVPAPVACTWAVRPVFIYYALLSMIILGSGCHLSQVCCILIDSPSTICGALSVIRLTACLVLMSWSFEPPSRAIYVCGSSVAASHLKLSICACRTTKQPVDLLRCVSYCLACRAGVLRAGNDIARCTSLIRALHCAMSSCWAYKCVVLVEVFQA
ncbi:hypothetical protein C8R45DRAFT_981679 [Mycena sanguinolenta]|nr:hypothetical protein C8R45DRAFT_981679 [Mycena sanguinolenta]